VSPVTNVVQLLGILLSWLEQFPYFGGARRTSIEERIRAFYWAIAEWEIWKIESPFLAQVALAFEV